MAITEDEVLDSQEPLKFEDLLARFKAKMDLIPEEYHEALGWLYVYRQIQDQRKRLANRATQMTGDGKRVFWASVLPLDMRINMVAEIKGAIKKIEENEEKAARELHKALRKTSWYLEVAIPAAKGVGMTPNAGTLSAAKILDAFASMSRFGTIGQLMRYARLAPEEGQAPKRKPGQRIRYNPKAWQALFDLTEVWVKMPDCHWRTRWDYWKLYYREKYPDPKTHPPMRIHYMARRKVMREFLHDLWDLWRAWEERNGIHRQQV